MRQKCMWVSNTMLQGQFRIVLTQSTVPAREFTICCQSLHTLHDTTDHVSPTHVTFQLLLEILHPIGGWGHFSLSCCSCSKAIALHLLTQNVLIFQSPLFFQSSSSTLLFLQSALFFQSLLFHSPLFFQLPLLVSSVSSTARTMSVSKPVHVCTLQVYKPVHKFATTSSVQACSLLANYEPDHISVSKLAHCLANGRLRGRAALIARAWHVMHAKRSGKILRASQLQVSWQSYKPVPALFSVSWIAIS